MLAVLCLTIGSCAGYLATPFQKRKWFPYLMIFMISLAVAVLTGDGIMHLLPHVSIELKTNHLDIPIKMNVYKMFTPYHKLS